MGMGRCWNSAVSMPRRARAGGLSAPATWSLRGLIPFIDLAYHGLGDGLAPDGAGARMMMEAVPAALLAYSCDKNFALYRDRVGALFVQAPSAPLAEMARANTLALARSLWSMPPDHGAAVVRMILDDAALRKDWRGASCLRAVTTPRPALAGR